MRGVLSYGLLFAASAGAGVWVSQVQEPQTSLTFMAVGQGDCTVFQTEGATILIDVGPTSPQFDTGERVVVPGLRRLGVGTVDLIFLTHPDLDHIGGLAAVMKSYKVGGIAVSAEFRDHPDLLAAFEQCHVDPEEVIWLPTRTKAEVGGFTLNIVSPIWNPEDTDNEGSLFIHLSNGAAGAMFTGDAGSETEMRMMGVSAWAAPLMKAGHHGSANSTCPEWLKTVHPQQVIVSCGRRNRYGHPNPAMIARSRAAGARLWRTDESGDIRFVLREGQFVAERSIR